MRDIVDEVIAAYDGIEKLKKRFGYNTSEAVYNWRSRGIPRSLVADIHVDTGMDIRKLQGIAVDPNDADPKAA